MVAFRSLLTMVILTVGSLMAVDFQRDIRPVLASHCFKCHGPDNGAREADLFLHTEEGLYASLSSDPSRHVIVPGDISSSEMIHRITSDDSDRKMPPAGSNLSLTEYEKALISRWIEQGAEWKPHWAFIPPEKFSLPMIISTGMSTQKEVDEAINFLSSSKLAVLHCVSTYPTPTSELNLNVIKTFQSKYPNLIIGYSGHEYDLEPSVIAVALGAKIIERHVTLDHGMWGTDQKSSLEVHAMDLLRKRIENINCILGNTEKKITDSEKDVMEKLRG